MVSDEIKQDLVLIGKRDGFITGDNNISEEIKGYENRVTFTGYVPDKLLMQYIVNADALIFPSLYEGFGLPPLEAMAAGVPVIASNVASMPEVCSEYVDYINPYNINDIANKLMSFNSDCKNIDMVLKKYNWNDKAIDIIKLISEVVEGGR